jgi:predicted ATP-grasp superfamily ATP-dependent carboligase
MRPPILLANTDWYGTLEATRSLGASGVPVYMACDRWLASARWSRHAWRVLRSPSLSEPHAFVDWLCALGEREPGIVLYPTSDEAAFLYALRLDDLSRSFRMYQPSLDTVLRVLDKKRLYAAAEAVGVRCPQTWFPESEAEVERIAREAPMPVLVKPRTQVLSRTHSKGIIVRHRADLVRGYRDLLGSVYGKALLDQVPDAQLPMIQVYHPQGAHQIYVLSAFTDRERKLFAARSGLKIFQQPRSLGVGLCFEDAPLDLNLVEGVRRLVDSVGYFGLLQLEFLRVGGSHLLIDFNPRFYNQLAFDVARGLPLPHMVYAGACGDAVDVEHMVDSALRPHERRKLVFCNGFGLSFMLATQRLTGRMSAREARRWRRWRDEHRASSVDPARAEDDLLPAVVDAASQLLGFARHPRSFVRKTLLDQTAV